jgi:hypothetical protein
MREWFRRLVMWSLDSPQPMIAGSIEIGEKLAPTVRVGVMDAMNGKLLEVSSYKQNSRGPDWTTTYWIMDERPLAEQIGMVIALKGLEK